MERQTRSSRSSIATSRSGFLAATCAAIAVPNEPPPRTTTCSFLRRSDPQGRHQASLVTQTVGPSPFAWSRGRRCGCGRARSETTGRASPTRSAQCGAGPSGRSAGPLPRPSRHLEAACRRLRRGRAVCGGERW